MLAVFAEKEGFRFRNLAVGSCPPLQSDVTPYIPAIRRPDCIASQAVANSTIDRFPVVIISSSWLTYQERSPGFLAAFFETVRSLSMRGKLVVLIGKAPIADGYDRRCLAKALSYPFLECPTARVRLSAEVVSINSRLKAFAAQLANVKYFDLTAYLCNEQGCMVFDPAGDPLYYDPNHLSMAASWRLGSALVLGNGTVPEPFAGIPMWSKAMGLRSTVAERREGTGQAGDGEKSPALAPRRHAH